MLNEQEGAKITPDEFLSWIPSQEGRYELVNGEITMMAGAGRQHDRIVANLIAAIRPQTRGGRCQTFTSDTYIATGPSTRRMPDLGIDCGIPSDDSVLADKPSLIVEVLSPSTHSFNVSVKLAEYKALASLDYILFVDTERPSVQLFWRDADGIWKDAVFEGLGASVALEKLNVLIPLGAIYDEIHFRPKPKLVKPEDGEATSG
ncbi:Uma2 family endonuclease [Bradyrhizobium jicamae]|uniref:Uma2 family endonuclease n=1 Tax=Bradyrhizobium jicamae TaxID=280332 RepID=UPI001BAA2D5F|nr:Uma2 family endonuclease [Bradyrhizobium jicamae]MBR0758466.1 Uma2 family endonuclease [Bradyrhizobium jicamae]